MPFTTSGRDGTPDLSNISTFLLNPGKPFISNKGVWHWAPYPIVDEWESFLIMEKDLIENDIEFFDLEKTVKINL